MISILCPARRTNAIRPAIATFESRLLLPLILALSFFASAAQAQVDVTATAGTLAASYTTLKGAFDAINAGTHQGVIAIGLSGNTTETAMASLSASGSGAASYSSVLITPTGGAPRTISGAIAAGSPLINLNGADNVTIDGLNTGGNTLTIANTTVSATSGTSTIRFIGGATGNVITNSNIQGSGTMSVATNGATIFFSTDALTANGNDNNTISNNNLGPAGANLPTKAILGNGSTTTTAIGNSGNIITNNNIFDYFGAAVTSSGVAVNGGCNTWTITNNRLYQTGSRTWTTGAVHRAIDLNSSTATSGVQAMTVTGNIIGYASSTQTGTYTLTGSTGKFQGIVFNGIAGGTASNLDGNTIASVSLTGVSSSGTGSAATPFAALLVTSGRVNTNSNTIGSQGAAGSLTLSTSPGAASAEIYGIGNFSSDDWTATGNQIGGISGTHLGGGSLVVYGIRASFSATKALNAGSNNIGGTVAGSIAVSSTSTGSQVIGLASSNAISTCTSNTVRNLGNDYGGSQSVVGMSFTTAASNQTVTQNTLQNLHNSNATLATVVIGIQVIGGPANVVARNLIYGLTTASDSTAGEVDGIRVAGGTTTYRNNMIAVGAGITNAVGTGSTTGGVNGILESGGTNSFVHNSVYVGGAAGAGVGPSYAFNSSVTSGTRSLRNNIFVNARSTAGAAGKNYAVRVGGTTPNPPGLTLNYNLYFANGIGAVFGFFNSLDVPNLAAWQVAVGQDAASIEFNPQFFDPANAVPDLHLHPSNPTPAEGSGVDLGVTDDFDGQTRSALTPVDLGADAGDFVFGDPAPPAITYTALTNTILTTNRTISATLTDATGVAVGGLAPRVYYRKGAGAYVSRACSLTGGTTTNGTWDCLIDHADLGGVAGANVISYFVIAQDTFSWVNIGSNPVGVAATDVNTIITPPAAPNSYTIIPLFSGSLNVGAAETYTSLTNAGGLFEAINNGRLTGNLVVDLTSDLLSESGTHALQEWVEEGVGGYTLLIRPSGAPRTVVGSSNGALIRLAGADRVTIEGSTLGGTAVGVGGDPLLRELTIQNTSSSNGSVIAVQSGSNGAQNNTLRNLIVLGLSPSSTSFGIAIGGNTTGTPGTDNDGNRIENCAVGRAKYGIYAAGQNAANPNSGTVITRNDLSATGPDGISRCAIFLVNDDGGTVTENSVGISNEDVFSPTLVGIGLGADDIDALFTWSGNVTNAWVARNRIDGVSGLGFVGASAAGIVVAGGTVGPNTIVNNMISGVTAPSTAASLVAGIGIVGNPGTITRVFANTVALAGDRGSLADQAASYAIAILGADPIVELKDNILANTQTTTGGGVAAKSYAIGMASSTFANLDSNYNDFFASGASAGNFRTGSLNRTGGTDLATLGDWQTAVSDDASSLAIDPLLTSASDLHLATGSPMLDAGLSLAGVTTDFDGEPRSATTPEIGADETAFADLSITKTDDSVNEIPGTPVTYTIVAANSGPDAASATVTDTFPLALSGCSTTCVGGGGGICTAVPIVGNLSDAVTLPVGGTVTYTATCNIASDATGTLSNTASVAISGTVADPAGGNNSATDSDNLNPVADLSITKTDGVTTATPGGSVTYTITASNAGPSDATGANVTDNFPGTLSCSTTCVGAGGGTCTAGPILTGINDTVNLPAGGSVTHTAVCSISGAATGSLVNTATVSAPGGVTDPNSGNDSATDTDTLNSSGVLQLSSAAYSGNEGTTLVATLNRVAGDSGAVGVTYTLTNGSATGGAACGAGVDFVDPGPQLLSFADLETSQPINVTLCSDAVFDAAETFTITISLPTGGATLGSPTAATATVADIAPPFSGPVAVGAGQNYTSLTNPGGIFEAINLAGASGNIAIQVTSDLTGETGTIPLNEIAGGFAVTLKPSGAPRSITGSAATGLIKLAGADNVTIDGSLAAGTDRSLTITNNGAGAVIWIATNATSGANNDTVQNCNLTGPGGFVGQGIVAGSGTTLTGAAEFPNSNNTLRNNAIKSVRNAAFISGNPASRDQNWLLTQNEVGSATLAEKLSFRGFYVGNAGNLTISRNVISGIHSSSSTSSTMSGIQIGVNVDGGTITGNWIGDIRQNDPAGWGSNGILLNSTLTSSNITVSNNFISDVASQGWADVRAVDNGYGIMINNGGGYRIVSNSILLNSDQVAVTGITAAVNIAAAVATPASIELRDNIFASTQTLGTRYGVLNSSTAGAAVFSTIDHNDYFAQNVGFLAAPQATLADWQTATGQDASSLAVDPLFVTVPAPADLHLQLASPMLNAGIALAGVAVDIDNDPRPAATPDIGADEVVQANLAITKTNGAGNVPPGGSTTYTIVATNLGASDAAGATVTDVFPADLTCSTTCVGTLGATCTAGPILTSINDTVNLPVGGVVTYTALCTLSPSAVGILSNTATVAPPVGMTDPVAANDSATDNDTTIPSADIGITKTDGSATEIPGTSVTYTIVATNAGPSPAPSVTVVDNFTGSLSGCSTTCVASAGSTCTAGPVAGNLNDVASLLVAGTATYTATCDIAATAVGALSNTATATVSGPEVDPATGNNTATDNDTLVPTADVTITKTNGVTQSTPGLPVTYTIVVSNAGPSAAPTVNVLDLFPASLTSCATTCVGAGGGTCTAGPVVGNINENANLPVGGSATYTASCTLSLSATGSLVNTATATVGGGATDPNTADNSATDTDTVGNTIFNDGFESGDTLLWSVTVPLTVEAYAVVGVDAATSAATFDYDFSAVQSGEELMATAIAVVQDASGKPLFVLGARRTESFGELEIALQFPGAGRSRWVPVSEIGQRVRIEWSLADLASLGQASVALDGLVVLRMEGYAGTASPAGAQLLRSRQAPTEP